MRIDFERATMRFNWQSFLVLFRRRSFRERWIKVEAVALLKPFFLP